MSLYPFGRLCYRVRGTLCSRQQQPALQAAIASHALGSTRNGSMLSQGFQPLPESDSVYALPAAYLRGMDPTKFDNVTFQRIGVGFDKASAKPLLGEMRDDTDTSKHTIVECVEDNSNNQIYIRWGDGVRSQFSRSWIEQELSRWKSRGVSHGRILWTDMTEETVRGSEKLSQKFADVLTEDGMSRAVKTLYQYGILLVTGTPIDDEGFGVAALAAALGGGSQKSNETSSLLPSYHSDEVASSFVLPHGTDGPMRTLYGTVWSTSAVSQADGASVADSAYGTDGLPLHTDMTYYADPPGLQIFSMVQPAESGGESIFGDGFAVAESLRQSDPESFELLARTVRRYRCIDKETGWHLEAHGPVITQRYGKVVAIRHNDLDRLSDLPPHEVSGPDDIKNFYQSLAVAHRKFDELLALDKFRLVLSLAPGDTIVVANQRCFHGRLSFRNSEQSPRTVMGCYVSQDELNSRFRLEGYTEI